MKAAWTHLISQFTTDQELIASSWQIIDSLYTEKHRAYHNLTHINNMLQEAEKHNDKIKDKEVLLFAIWFHDIVYDPLSKENERQSAEMAQRILSQTSLSRERISDCYQKIMLTKGHQLPGDASLDDCLFIDFDLEVLSWDWEQYQVYSQQIREEYSMYVDSAFRAGRSKAMSSFLEREWIYQSDFYRKEQEAKARKNIEKEIELLEKKQ